MFGCFVLQLLDKIIFLLDLHGHIDQHIFLLIVLWIKNILCLFEAEMYGTTLISMRKGVFRNFS
jgi:hypothetical protein